MEISVAESTRLAGVMSALNHDRQPFVQLWRELANYFMPKRYVWLETSAQQRLRNAKNPFILDSTGTTAGRILAAGLMNGITSPSRPWMTLRVPGYDDEGGPVTLWADECTRRILQVLGESNFYNAMAVQYLDLTFFGTSAVLIYEDPESVIRCYNSALGEYFLAQDDTQRVNTFAREICLTVRQLVQWFGESNCSTAVKSLNTNTDGGSKFKPIVVQHLIEPNFPGSGVPPKFAFIETYWEKGQTRLALVRQGFNELPGIFPRWEVTGNDSYGTSPGMDALPDTIQLQFETKRKAQGIDKMISPPIVADIQLQHRPTALMPNGITYVAGANNVGAKPLYQISAPIQEITEDIRDVRGRIQEIFHNPLFNMISQLETVRSATEIDARREEKLVLLGPVLERFENEALDPAIERVFNIMLRKGLFPEAPPEVEGSSIQVQYVSILATAQRAVAATPTERWLQIIGNIAPIIQLQPGAKTILNIPNWEELIRNYGIAIGVEARNMHTRDEVAAMNEADAQAMAKAEGIQDAGALVQAGQQLSETDVGGGSNALQMLLAQG